MKWISEASAAGKVPETLRFGRPQRRPRGTRIPVIVVTGFLGAGKTTLVRALLQTPEGANSAVVVNEFGEIGIDQALLRDTADTVVLLGNGCLCCVVRSDLEVTLRQLAIDRTNGVVPNFERVIIETSGIADPVPILQTFLNERALGRDFHVAAMITAVDAVAGGLADAPEWRRQIAVADRVVVTKSDLADADRVEAVKKSVRDINPNAAIFSADEGKLDPAVLLADGLSGLQTNFCELPVSHMRDLQTFVLNFEEPLRWDVLSSAIDMLIRLRGADILRVKGLVALLGCRGPVVVQVVQHLTHPPIELQAWPDGDRRSRLVFITRGLAVEPVRKLFDAAIEISPVKERQES